MHRSQAERGAAGTVHHPLGHDFSVGVFDRAARLAQNLFGRGSGASIILVHDGTVWRSHHADTLPTADSFTEAVVRSGQLCWIEDGLADPAFRDHPLVTGPPYLRFTVAVPIRLKDGSTPGVLSVSGGEPQPFDDAKAMLLKDIASFVADEWQRSQSAAALARSLSERDQALERLERSEARLQIALSLTGIHVWDLDYDRRELTKAGAEDSFFCEPLTFEGLYRDVLVTIDPRDRADVAAAWKAHVETGAAYKPQFRIARADGKEVWAESSATYVTDGDGRPLRLIGALQDITARTLFERALRAAKDEADAANRAKSTFLATMSHELRTPLNAILGFAEMIAKQIVGPLPLRYVDYAQSIHASGSHLLDLVNDVLDISKLEAGKFDLHETVFDLDEVLAELGEMFARQAEEACVDLRVALAAPAVTLTADRRIIKQVLLNVVSNALKFTERGGTVGVAAAATGADGLVISVRDNGVGMSAAEIAVALTPFGQVNSRIARRNKGTGLGVPISHALMKLHGGDLLIASEQGKGTCVTLTLPAGRLAAAKNVAAG